MAHIIFYGMPDCKANARQRKQLEAAGHTVEVRDLTAESWTPETLAPYFAGRPVNTWLNKLHPKVRTNAIDPDSLSPETALAHMIADTTLIRRPLMAAKGEMRFGFDPVAVDNWVGLRPKSDGLTCDEKHAQGRCDHGHHQFPKAS